MTIVQFAIAHEPAPALLTLFSVHIYWSNREGLTRARSLHFANMELALRAAKDASRRAPAVMVVRVRGNPEVDYWEGPVTVAKFGDRAEELPRLDHSR